VDAREGFEAVAAGRFAAYTALSQGEVRFAGQNYPYKAGQSFLIPMNMGAYALFGGKLLRAMLP